MNLYSHQLVTRPDFSQGENWKTCKLIVPLPKEEGRTTEIMLSKDHKHLAVEDKRSDKDWVEFHISSMQNNCGLVLLHSMEYTVWDDDHEEWETAEYHQMDVAFMFDLAISFCGIMGYSQILYTVSDKQEDLVQALEKKGFKLLEGSTVRNKRSNNDISMYVFNI